MGISCIREKISGKIMSFKQGAKRSGFTLMEILIACAIIIALSCAAFFGYQHAQQTRKMAQMYNDMEAIRTAAITYEALSVDSTAAASISVLMNGLSSSESIDGADHDDLLQVSRSNSSSTSITDPWGNAYEYSQSERSISCTPYDASGDAMDEVTVYF